jgi:UDP-glucose:(heptosyl)LPS alpha-1,3-glucosyltransferase
VRIALVIERMDTARGGRETSTAQIASRLAEAGNEVVILCQKGAIEAPGVEVRALGAGGWTRTSRARRFIQAAQEAIRRERFDIVHSMLPLPGANVYQLRSGTVPAQAAASLRRRTPPGQLLAGFTRRFNRHRSLMAEMEAHVMADARTHLLAVSEMVASEVREFYGRSENLRVVFNAVDVPAADEEQRADWRQRLRFQLGVGSGDVMMLVVANNFELKGVSRTIEAFGQWMRRRNSVRDRLVIIGRDPAAAEGYARQAGIRSVGLFVHFLPPTRDIFRWYSAADICVLLSWYDPCSRVVLEATRWGLPSITTRFNGAAEIVEEGCGVVVPSPASQGKIVAAMDFMSVESARQYMSENCRAMSPRLSIERHVDELLKVYKEILAK